MLAHTLQSQWQKYREAVRCSNLREELRLLLYGSTGNEEATIQRLIKFERYRHPDKLESWYLYRVIDSIRRGA